MAGGPTLKILYVDDEADLVAVVLRAFRLDPSIDGKGVTSGQEALALLESDQWRPDVILLDVMMPDLDGLMVAEKIAHLPSGPIPVIFFTARSKTAELVKLTQRYSIGIITKPFNALTLAASIRQTLHDAGRNGQDAGGKQ